MTTFVVAFIGLIGFLLTREGARRLGINRPLHNILHNLNRFFLAFATAGLLFSGLEAWLAFSDDLEGTSRRIRELETELARLRTVATFLKPSPGLELSVYLLLIFLFVAPFWSSHRKVTSLFGRYLRVVSTAYVWLTLLTSLTFFGSTTASPTGLLAQRIATIEHHIERIEDRYAIILPQADRKAWCL